MIHPLNYSGLTTVPSDYECPDGSLAASLNLISEDSQIKPVFSPKPLMRLIDGGRLVLIHHVPGQTNYIIQRGTSLFWMPKPSTPDATDTEATHIKDFGSINDLAIIGNTITIASSDTQYILWKDGAYLNLGSKPPFINIEFGCRKSGTLNDSEELHLNTRRAQNGTEPAIDEETNNAVYGLMLPPIASTITAQGYFYMPFFVRYAYRLYDGSHNWHSAPILMLPSVIMPIVSASKGAVSDGLISVMSTLDIPYFALMYKISGISNISDWKDIVSGIDIYITPQIYTYDQSAKIGYITNTRSQLLCGYHDYNPNEYGTRGRRESRGSTPDDIFIGHYSEFGDTYIDHTKSTAVSESVDCWRLSPNENFHDQIKSCNGGSFYKIASFDIDSLQTMLEFNAVPLSSSKLDTLTSLERLIDEYQSHQILSANTAIAYNNRLCLSNISIKPPKPFSLASSVQASSASQGTPPAVVQIEVFSRINGVICHNVNSDSLGNTWDISGHFPRYIYYPDSSAYKMNLRYGGQDHYIDLVPHDFLNGAYYYGSLSEDATPSAFSSPETATPEDSVSLPNKIYVSEVSNPFVFPAQSIVTVGNGSVLALASAAKALSQGQFGQFPLYAFCSDGIWALEVSSTGTFSARQPISRDVILDDTTPLQMDSTVLFATKRGIMEIAGSKTSCISDVICSDTPFDVTDLPHLEFLHQEISGHTNDACIPTIPFSQFLTGCKMIYDYIAQRIIVFNPRLDYAYIYSLRSQQWGMMLSHFTDTVPSYPDALAITEAGSDNLLVDLDSTSDDTSYGILVTRPIKLLSEGSNADMLKTIDTVIQRGSFARGHVSTVLYGSRDLIHWHIIYTSRDHFLRGFSGTGYKYFRIALLTSLKDGESIFNATIAFTPRHTNRLR